MKTFERTLPALLLTLPALLLPLAGCTSSDGVDEEDIDFEARPDAGMAEVDAAEPDAAEDAAPDSMVGPAPGTVGAHCGSDDDCDGELTCIEDPSFLPGGYCTQECQGAGDCPEGSACVPVSRQSGLCLDVCDPSGEARQCRSGYGCATSFNLPDNVCIGGCTDDSDCDDPTRCDPMGGSLEEGGCFLPGAAPGDPCEGDVDCPQSGICFSERFDGWPKGTCATPCDPTTGGGCDGGTCVPTRGGGLCLAACTEGADACREGYACEDAEGPGYCGPGCTSDEQCTDGRVCNAGLGLCDEPFDPDRLGQECSRDGGCPGGDCLSEFFNGFPGAYCVYFGCTVGASGTCPGDGVCIDAGGGDGVCVDGCENVDDCRSGYGCEPADREDPEGPTACMPACTADDQCANDGFVCNEGTGLCSFPLDSEEVGEPCSGGFRECRGGRCLTEDGDEWPEGMCVAVGCRLTGEGPSEPCPDGTRCSDDGGGDPELGMCLPTCADGDAECRMGYECAEVVDGTGVCRPAED